MNAILRPETSSCRLSVPVYTPAQKKPIKLGLLSSGLGRINRGFELTTARWYEAIKSNPQLETKLYAGGNYSDAKKIFNIPRDLLLASPLKYLRNFSQYSLWQFCYIVEQVTFSLCLSDLLVWRPHVLWTKEVPLAHFLLVYKYMFNLKYKIIFANGGAFRPSTYKDFDFIQHLHPDSYAEAAAFGIPETRMQVLPNCVVYNKPPESKEQLRARFGFADSDWIIICVAAWNSFQKRLDYLIDEVAAMNDPNVKLLLCGQPEIGTAELQALGAAKLGDRVKWMTLPPQEVHSALSMSDVFVLPSFKEGLASSIIEAAMAGIPIVSHPHSGGRYILEDPIWLEDLSQPGNLTRRLVTIKQFGVSTEQLADLQKNTCSRFTPGRLADKFVDIATSLTSQAHRI